MANDIKKVIDYNRVCPICHKEFVAKVHNAVYCSSKCRNYASECRRDGILDYKRVKICNKCGKEFIPKKNGWTRNYCFECVPDGIVTSGGAMRKIIKNWGLEYKGG